jgi:hypothetical protein
MWAVAGNDSRAIRPCEFVIGGAWPWASLADHHGARVAQRVARRLAEAMARQRLSAKRLGRISGVNRQTIANVLNGVVWPDLLTIANLEHALQERLWPLTDIGELSGDAGEPVAAEAAHG